MATAIDEGVSARFLDASQEPNQVLLPIKGYEKEPLLPLEEAVQPLNAILSDLDTMVDIARKNSKKPSDGLTTNESAAIHIYTMQWEESHLSLYAKLNKTLRSERRETLKPWFRYLKLILTALYKLPSLKTTVWRGVPGNLTDQYEDDQIWWGFSSCTESVDVMEEFIGKSGVRTLFNIECMNGKAIRAHSFYKKENEILLMPGTYLQVVGKWSPAKNLHIIHLRETPAPGTYLEPPFKTSPTVTSIPETVPANIDPPVTGKHTISKQKVSPSVPQAATQPKQSVTSKQPSQPSNETCKMTGSLQDIRDNFKKAYPNDLILVYKFTPPGGAGSYNGTKLLETKVEDGQKLKAFKLTRSEGPHMNSDEIKLRAFPFVYDTKSITDDNRRRDILKNSLKNVFPDHHVNVFIFDNGWSRSCCSKGSVSFKNEYGSTIDIVLS